MSPLPHPWTRRLGMALRTAILVSLMALLGGCAPDRAGEPAAITEGRAVYGRYCAACHGDDGGGGTGPALADVAATFPDCSDHMEWIRLGSQRWLDERGPTYGADDTEVAGGMPPWNGILTDPQLTAVAAFERSAFGDVDQLTAVERCGAETE